MGNLGRTAEAIRAHQRSLELDPNNAQARAGLGVALIFARRAEEGLEHIDRATRLSPQDPLVYNWLGFRAFAALLLGRLEEAVENARASLERGSTYIAWLALGGGLALLGRTLEASQAREEYERLPQRPEVTTVLPTLRALARSEEEAERLITALREAGFDAG
jgi:tetratricopeptide (TPR) repeat protein